MGVAVVFLFGLVFSLHLIVSAFYIPSSHFCHYQRATFTKQITSTKTIAKTKSKTSCVTLTMTQMKNEESETDNMMSASTSTARNSTINIDITAPINTAAADIAEAEWKERLTAEQFYVLREAGTERPFSSPLNMIGETGKSGEKKEKDGVFLCAGCGAPLFSSFTKFDSGTGWPSFTAPITNDAVTMTTDFKLILPRTEVSCANCNGHLGHVFADGPTTIKDEDKEKENDSQGNVSIDNGKNGNEKKEEAMTSGDEEDDDDYSKTTGQRFCMNGVAMTYQSYEDMDPQFVKMILQQKMTNPYRLSLTNVWPNLVLNGTLLILFVQSFMAQVKVLEETTTSSPIVLAIPALSIVYCMVQIANILKRL